MGEDDEPTNDESDSASAPEPDQAAEPRRGPRHAAGGTRRRGQRPAASPAAAQAGSAASPTSPASGPTGPTTSPAGPATSPAGSATRGAASPEQQHEGRPPRTGVARTAALLLGALVLGVGFIASYVGGLHDPAPHNIPVAVIAGDQGAITVMNTIRQQTDDLLPVTYSSPDAASDALARRSVYGVLASATSAPGGLLLMIASGGAPGVSDVVTRVLTAAAAQANVVLTVRDAHPTAAGDPRSLTSFYLVLGWIVGGYLAATAISLGMGRAPRGLGRFAVRTLVLALYSVVFGVLGTVLTGPALHIWDHDQVRLAAAGSLIVFAAAAIGAAFGSWLGLGGIGLAIGLLVILGNPGSGGIFAPPLLPAFFRGTHRWLPTGLATDLVRGIEYFHGSAITGPAIGLAIWAAGALLTLLAATMAFGRRARGV